MRGGGVWRGGQSIEHPENDPPEISVFGKCPLLTPPLPQNPIFRYFHFSELSDALWGQALLIPLMIYPVGGSEVFDALWWRYLHLHLGMNSSQARRERVNYPCIPFL